MSRTRRMNFDDESSRVPDGTYDAVVSSIEETQAKSSGNDMYIWALRLPDIGQHLDVYTVLTSAALWNLKRILSALDLPHEGEVDVDPDECEGRCMVITVENEEYNGKMRPNVSDFAKHPRGAFALRNEEEEMRGKSGGSASGSSFKDPDVPF